MRSLRQRHGEDETPAGPFLRPYAASMAFHYLSAYGQSETGRGGHDALLFHPVESLENTLHVVFRDTRPLIGYRELSHAFGRFSGDGESASLGGVAAGVFQQITEYLRDVMRIGMDVHAPVDLDLCFEVAFFQKGQAEVQRVLQNENGPYTGRLERNGSRFQPGKMEHIVYEQGHVPRVAQYDPREFLAVFRVVRRQVEYGFGKTDDGGKRSTQFVRDFTHEFPAAAVQAHKVADIVEHDHGAGSSLALSVVFQRGDADIEHRIFPKCDAERRGRTAFWVSFEQKGVEHFVEDAVRHCRSGMHTFLAGGEEGAEGGVGLEDDALPVQHEDTVVEAVENVLDGYGGLTGAEGQMRLIHGETGTAGGAIGCGRLFHGSVLAAVAYAAHGLDDVGGFSEAGAQAFDVGVHGTVVAFELIVPA